MHPFERSVLRGCRRLVEPGARVVVALSGGPDSSALLAALAALRERLGIAELIAAHLDHGIRGAEAKADAEAAAAFAKRLSVECVVGTADAPAELVLRGRGSLEAAARAVRYRFLATIARERGATCVALGHTADDQAETVLLRLLRGAGLRGASGMPRRRALPESDGARVVRPMLRTRRAQVLAYLAARELPFVEDASNRDRRFLRNRLRLDVMPLLRAAANPAVDEALLRMAEQARRAQRLLEREARALLVRAAAAEGWSAKVLVAADPAVLSTALARIVRRLAPDRASTAHVDALRALLRSGAGTVSLPGGMRVALEGGALCHASDSGELRAPFVAPISLSVPGETLDREAGLVFTARIGPPVDPVGDPARVATLDADCAAGDLAVRRRRSGDAFWPLGAPGGRTLKRFFNDRKVPRMERASVPVVTLDDRPVWIVGHRIDERYKVTPATRRVLHIEARPVETGGGVGT